MRIPAILCAMVALGIFAHAGDYEPAAGMAGSTAISATSDSIHGWATGVVDLHAGWQDISDHSLGSVTWGYDSDNGRFPGIDALGAADAASDSLPVVSLGDGGWITLSFAQPITNGPGFDFAVFENGLTDTFLELAFVEVRSEGGSFVRFNSVSQTQTTSQLNGDFSQTDENDDPIPFGSIDPTNLHNLAGKYRRGFGTPFDLAELAGQPGLDISRVIEIRIVDVVGSVARDSQTNQFLYATFDSQGHAINDPWRTPYDTGGFDLDAIAVINQVVPEPSSAALFLLAVPLLARRFRPV